MNRIEKYVLIVVILIMFFTVFLSSAVLIALPSIASEFHMSNILQNWVTLLYFLAVAVVTIPSGQISGKFGLKKTMVFGAAVFTLSSFIIMFSNSQDMFLILRIFQGIGAGFLSVASMAMVVSACDAKNRGKAIGITVTGISLATFLSPVLAGFLNTNYGWRSLFIFTIPFLLISLALLIVKINKEWNTLKDVSLDVKGCIAYALGILLFVFGFSNLNRPDGIIYLIVGIVLLIAFVLIELKVKHPALDVKLFKNKNFAYSNFAALSAAVAGYAIITVINYNLQYIRGLDPQQSSIFLMIAPIAQVVITPIAGGLSDKYNPLKLSAIGMLLAGIGTFMVAMFSVESSEMFLIVSLVLQGLGFGVFSSPNTNAIMSAVPAKNTSMASASASAMRVIGQTVSTGILTLVFAFIMGKALIAPENYHLVITSCEIIAIIFTVFCIISIIASLIGSRYKNSLAKASN